MSPAEGDPGLAFERTHLAWNRTGLSAVVLGALALKAFDERLDVGVPLAMLFVLVGVLAYRTGAQAPADPSRLRLLSLGVTAAALVAGVATIVG